MYLEKNELLLEGSWHQIKFEHVFEGVIGKLFFEYTKDKENDFIFYGISSHNKKNGFSYFIGYEDARGNLILPKGIYLQNLECEIAYEMYQKIAKENHAFKELYDSSFEFDLIPTKIEKYHYKDSTVTLVEILIPIDQ